MSAIQTDPHARHMNLCFLIPYRILNKNLFHLHVDWSTQLGKVYSMQSSC